MTNIQSEPTKDAEYWLSPEGLALIRGWTRDGITDDLLADKMGIRRKTFWVWRGKYPALAAACKEGKEVADYNVESALYKSALEGNVTAMIFWLKNRKPKQWNSPNNENIGINMEQIQIGLEALSSLLIFKKHSSEVESNTKKIAQD